MREVDDDVVALGDALLVERVSVIGLTTKLPSLAMNCERHRLPVPGLSDASLMKRDMQALRMRKRYFRGSTSMIRRIGEVDERHVAEEAVGGEDVEEAAGRSASVAASRHDQVHVEVDVAPVEQLAARQAQVDAVVQLLVAAVRARCNSSPCRACPCRRSRR